MAVSDYRLLPPETWVNFTFSDGTVPRSSIDYNKAQHFHSIDTLKIVIVSVVCLSFPVTVLVVPTLFTCIRAWRGRFTDNTVCIPTPAQTEMAGSPAGSSSATSLDGT